MILTVTLNPAIDHTVTLDEVLEPDVVHRTTNRRFDPGGKGINVSQVLDELGTETTATALVGGRIGSYIEHALSEKGLRNVCIDIDGISRVNTTILARDEEYKINQTGPPVGIERVSELIDVIRGSHPDTVVVGGSLPRGLGSGAIDYIAGAGNWRTVVDSGGDVLRRLDKRYALAAPNRDELAAATGMSTETVSDCVTAGHDLREQGYERVLVSIGRDGALLIGPRGDYHAFVPETHAGARDTTGGGDALLAGVLSAMDSGASDERALARGVAIASRSVSASGTGVPDLSGLDELLESVDVTPYEEAPGTDGHDHVAPADRTAPDRNTEPR